MVKYSILFYIFLFVVIAASLASIIGINVQSIYRIPFINIRWIDVAIIVIVVSYFTRIQVREKLLSNNRFIVNLCYVYLLYSIYQLAKSWQMTDVNSQISHFICTLSIFIIIDLSTFKIDKKEIIQFIRKFAIYSSIALIVSNFVLLYSFISGKIIFTDSGIRIALDITGKKESVYAEVIIGLVYNFGLYAIQNKSKNWEKLKILFIVAVISIYVALVFSYARGILFMIGASTGIYMLVFSKNLVKALIQVFSLSLILVIFYFMFGKTLGQKGYDPVEKITEIVKFTMDVKNPEWDKGRSISRKYATDAWKENFWTGNGYDDLYNHGLPPTVATAHNFVVTSLFHNGVIGTVIYLLIMILLFRNSVRLWRLLNTEDDYSRDTIKLLIISSFFWLILAMTQEAYWEKHSLSIEFLYLGLITNYYKQLVE
jgi:hypothetical protein